MYILSDEVKTVNLVYVEWFKLASNRWDLRTEMFKIKKADNFGVIEIEAIERGVHLMPCFKGFDMQMEGMDISSNLDEYKGFLD